MMQTAEQHASQQLDLAAAAALLPDEVLQALGSSSDGLSTEEAQERLARVGHNAVRRHSVRAISIFVSQLRNPFLALLLGTALASLFLGEKTDAIIIFLISALSVGLSFLSEYRSARAVDELHSQLTHTIVALRDRKGVEVDVTELVPGDVVRIDVGDVVPADLRLLEANELECDESVLTGESEAAEKDVDPVEKPSSRLDLPSCAFMGTVVRGGDGVGVVVVTGSRTEFGTIATQLSEREPQTAFQRGLSDYSVFLVRITAVLALSILFANIARGRSVIDSMLFALSISIGMTPQLLPAIVSVSLSAGARRLAKKKVIVKRLVAIEDFGNIDVFFTDKTGTLTEGQIRFASALDATGAEDDAVLLDGLLCNEAVMSDGNAVGGNALDRALWNADAAKTLDVTSFRRLAERPFNYNRRLASALVEDGAGKRTVIVKGAPDALLPRCREVATQAQQELDEQFAGGSRVVAVGTRDGAGRSSLGDDDERDLELAGFLTFLDPAKPDAGEALDRLRKLHVEVKVITGDNDRVAITLCKDIGLAVRRVLTGPQIDALDDEGLAAAVPGTTVFARVTPDQKSRVINAQRGLGSTVGFMGDGVNDAVALHDADVGISVDSATDVAKDAADIVLLEKNLDILADGIGEGRRTFANTIKYVLMGTSSNFGNMFSAGAGSFFLSFLPLLPTQILLNNLLYDVSEITIPTDTVDPEQVERPAHWDIAFIRRFMLFFGPISSLFDFATFAILLVGFNAGHTLFRSGWFVESLATQSLAIFAIRTRRIPFLRSHPSTALTATTLAVVAVGFALPYSPLAHTLGFTALPWRLVLVILVLIPTYLLLLELGKRYFYAHQPAAAPPASRRPRERSIMRRAARWTVRGRSRRPAQQAAAG
jgi:Mg2+-importing ATPase